MGIAINPSILSADFANLQRELERISTADAAHIDVMDNHFVPNLTWGPPVVKRLREISPVPFDVHLMIEDADRWAPEYASMGCESVTFHAEAAIAPIKLARTLRLVRSLKEKGVRLDAVGIQGHWLLDWPPTDGIEQAIDALAAAFAAAFVVYEAGLFGFALVAGGTGTFTTAIVTAILLNDACWAAALFALHAVLTRAAPRTFGAPIGLATA